MKVGRNVIINKNEIETEKNSVLKSWSNIELIEENNDRKGLREPQIGAIYALLSHWTISSSDSTIVLPTGVGKTDTMIGIILTNKCDNILIIVPSKSLRNQLTKKIASLGIFKELGLVNKSVKTPIIGKIEHIIETVEDVEELFKTCNILIATMNIVNMIKNEEIKDKLYENTDYLFIDEAHHIGAKTWMNFKKAFQDTKIVQFTATPYRNDGKSLEGEIIYNYPLSLAQKNNYFSKINFIPIEEYENKDLMIAKKAIEILKIDLENKNNHILMARTNNINRAKKLYDIYKEYNEYNPKIIVSNLSKKEKETTIKHLKKGKIKIIICVDMLGEGFDLPELKIGALHDPHKSLGVTIQFIGRFTRNKKNSGIGEAKIIANIADKKMNDEIKELYKKDSDWNVLIKNKSEKIIHLEKEKINFSKSFNEIEINSKNIDINFLKVTKSALIFKTNSVNWRKEKLVNNIKNDFELFDNQNNLLVILEKDIHKFPWGNIEYLKEFTWNIYIFYFDKKSKLLYVNSSTKERLNKYIEILVNEPTIIDKEKPFRAFYNYKRIILYIVGLKELYGGHVRYQMLSGIDVEEAISDYTNASKTKSNIFGVGYEEGERNSLGVSSKGRIWQKETCLIYDWLKWCNHIGAKVTNDSISIDKIIKGILIPKKIEKFPDINPVYIEFPKDFYDYNVPEIKIHINEKTYHYYNVSIELSENNYIDKKLDYVEFKIITETYEINYHLKIQDKKFKYINKSIFDCKIQIGNKIPIQLSEYFEKNPPIIQFADLSFMENDYYYKPKNIKNDIKNFNTENIETWNWEEKNVDIKKESKLKNNKIERASIQYFLIEKLKEKNYDLIINDDRKGEIAM